MSTPKEEAVAIAGCVEALEKLTEEERNRVLRYLQDRYPRKGFGRTVHLSSAARRVVSDETTDGRR